MSTAPPDLLTQFKNKKGKGFSQLNGGQQDMAMMYAMMAMNTAPEDIEAAGLADFTTRFFNLENFDQFRALQRNAQISGTSPHNLVKDLDFSRFDFNGTENALLDLIAKHESRGDYNIVYGDKRVNLTEMTINEVRAWQREYVNNGSPSSAVGRYQIIQDTMAGLVKEMNLTGNELFNEEMQDRMAIQLMERRGYSAFLEGRMSETKFMNNLSKEWASLPKDMGGRSYYDGDGLNAALVSPQTVMAAIRHARTQHEEAQKTPVASAAPDNQGLKNSFANAGTGTQATRTTEAPQSPASGIPKAEPVVS